MPKLVWLGEAHLHGEGETPPQCNVWNGIEFPVGVPVVVTDPYMLRKAGPPFWRVIPDNADDGRASPEFPPIKRGPGRPRKVP